MTVKLRDVALKAGVSVSTVSNVLNSYTRSGIKQETCDRVRKVAQEMGYRPNALARSLKVQRTNTIGFYTGYGSRDARDRFRAEIYTGLQAACDNYNFDFHLPGNLSGKSPEEIRMRLCDGRVDGVIVLASHDDPTVKCLIESRLPAVAIVDRHGSMPSVTGSDELGMQLLVDHLWRRGHKRMMYLEPHEPKESITNRINTFTRTLSGHGGTALVERYPWDDPQTFLRDLLKQEDRPTVLCSFNDDSAYILLRRFREMGIECPKDIALAGYDGLLGGNASQRDLLTVGVRWERIAFEGVRLLEQLIEGNDVPLLTCFPPHLIEGDTV